MTAALALEAPPISGIPVLEVVPDDIPITVLGARAVPPPRVARASGIQQILDAAARTRDEVPNTKRGGELLGLPPFEPAVAPAPAPETSPLPAADFAEEPAALDSGLLRAHRRTMWLAIASTSAWFAAVVAAGWLLHGTVSPLRAEEAALGSRAPSVAVADAEPAPEAAQPVAPPPVEPQRAQPARKEQSPTVAPEAVMPLAADSAEPPEAMAAADAEAVPENAEPAEVAEDLSDNPYDTESM